MSQQSALISFTPVLSTSALSANEVWFDTTAVSHAFFRSSEPVYLRTIHIQDDDDATAAAITFFFLKSLTSLGTINNAPDPTDTESLEIYGVVVFPSASFVDVVANKVGTYVLPVPMLLKQVQGSTTGTIWVAATNAGTPTNTASGAKITLGVSH